MKPLISALLLFLLPMTLAAESVTVIRAGALFDSVSGQLQNNMMVLIRDNTIAEVGADLSIPEGAEIVDLSDWTVMPGLIDLHTHLSSDPERIGLDRGAFVFQYPERATLVAAKNAETTLMSGFTTVREVGAPGTVSQALRDAINDGLAVGPRVIAGLGMGTTGSHCDPMTGVRSPAVDMGGQRSLVFNGADEAQAMVREAVRRGADVIKICATAGVLSMTDEIGPAQMTPAELQAIIDTAHMLNRRVVAHAHGREGIYNAVVAGITSIDHGSMLDEEIVTEMRQRGTWLVPTLMAFHSVTRMAEAGELPPGPAQKTFEIGEYIVDSFQLAYRSGVKIAFGTDSGVFEHGHNNREFALMVEMIGMTPAETLIAATRSAAEVLGMESQLGTIEAGKYADMVAVRGNPLEDITVMEDVGFVMKGGVVFKSAP